MTYLIDGRSLQDRSAFRGIGTYLRGLLSGFAEIGAAENVQLLLRNGTLPAELEQFGIGRAGLRIPVTKRSIQPLLDPFLIARALRRIRPSVYHGVDFGQPIVARMPVVITVHDLIPFVFPDQYRWTRRERLFALRLLRRADAIIADSAATARDVVRIAHVDNRRVHVVPLGVSPDFRPAAPAAVAEMRSRLLPGSRPYLLGVGTFDPRKRIGALAQVAARIRREHDVSVVVVGDQGKFQPRLDAAFAAADISNHVQVLGHVNQPDLINLYTGAACLLFTSAYEGFGLPPLEAMACGAPVAMFDNSSLREIAGDAAITARDGDVAALAEAVSRLLADSAETGRRRDQGLAWAGRFSWRATAIQTLAVYEQVLRAHEN